MNLVATHYRRLRHLRSSGFISAMERTLWAPGSDLPLVSVRAARIPKPAPSQEPAESSPEAAPIQELTEFAPEASLAKM